MKQVEEAALKVAGIRRWMYTELACGRRPTLEAFALAVGLPYWAVRDALRWAGKDSFSDTLDSVRLDVSRNILMMGGDPSDAARATKLHRPNRFLKWYRKQTGFEWHETLTVEELRRSSLRDTQEPGSQSH